MVLTRNIPNYTHKPLVDSTPTWNAARSPHRREHGNSHAHHHDTSHQDSHMVLPWHCCACVATKDFGRWRARVWCSGRSSCLDCNVCMFIFFTVASWTGSRTPPVREHSNQACPVRAHNKSISRRGARVFGCACASRPPCLAGRSSSSLPLPPCLPVVPNAWWRSAPPARTMSGFCAHRQRGPPRKNECAHLRK